MPSVWETYKDIDPKAPKPVFERIINGNSLNSVILRFASSLFYSFPLSSSFCCYAAFLISEEDRRALVQALLTDVKDDRFPADGKQFLQLFFCKY